MTASEHLKKVAWNNARVSSVVMAVCAIVAHTPVPVPIVAGCLTIIALNIVWVLAWMSAHFVIWKAEQESAIESIYLTEGTAQMQRRIIELREENKKLKGR